MSGANQSTPESKAGSKANDLSANHSSTNNSLENQPPENQLSAVNLHADNTHLTLQHNAIAIHEVRCAEFLPKSLLRSV